jgi:hypothetical protein
MNGGAWLVIEGQRVDLIYRDLDEVERRVAETEVGDFEVQLLGGFLAGFPTYMLAGELAINKVLVGDLPRTTFPAALRESAPPRWRDRARFSVRIAAVYAHTGEVVQFGGLIAKATVETAHARLAERGEWALNEKRIVSRGGVREVEYHMAALGARTPELLDTLERVAMVLGVPLP